MNPALFQQSLYWVIPSHIQVIFTKLSCLCPATVTICSYLLKALMQRSARLLHDLACRLASMCMLCNKSCQTYATIRDSTAAVLHTLLQLLNPLLNMIAACCTEGHDIRLLRNIMHLITHSCFLSKHSTGSVETLVKSEAYAVAWPFMLQQQGSSVAHIIKQVCVYMHKQQ